MFACQHQHGCSGKARCLEVRTPAWWSGEDNQDTGCSERVSGEVRRFAQASFDLVVGAIQARAQRHQQVLTAADHLGDHIHHRRRHERAIGEMKPEQIVGEELTS